MGYTDLHTRRETLINLLQEYKKSINNIEELFKNNEIDTRSCSDTLLVLYRGWHEYKYMLYLVSQEIEIKESLTQLEKIFRNTSNINIMHSTNDTILLLLQKLEDLQKEYDEFQKKLEETQTMKV